MSTILLIFGNLIVKKKRHMIPYTENKLYSLDFMFNCTPKINIRKCSNSHNRHTFPPKKIFEKTFNEEILLQSTFLIVQNNKRFQLHILTSSYWKNPSMCYAKILLLLFFFLLLFFCFFFYISLLFILSFCGVVFTFKMF